MPEFGRLEVGAVVRVHIYPVPTRLSLGPGRPARHQQAHVLQLPRAVRQRKNKQKKKKKKKEKEKADDDNNIMMMGE